MDDNNVSLEELRRWISENNIPATPPYKRTLLDIVGCAHHENNWSDIYKFFLDEKEEHGLGDLFIRSLEETAGFENDWMKKFRVLREVPTTKKKADIKEEDKKQGRIDLLILGVKGKAIIIENKVNATLLGNNNPLKKYVDFVKDNYKYNDVKRIVLAVTKNSIDLQIAENPYGVIESELNEYRYQYITHIELVTKILENLPRYVSNANPIYLPLLYDFIQNIKNVTYMNATEEEKLFFSEHYTSINQIYSLYERVVKEYKIQLKNLSFEKELRLVPQYKSINDDEGNKQLMYLQYSDKPIFLTLYFNSIWEKQPYIRVILEVKDKKIINHISELEDNIRDDKCLTLSKLEDREKYGHIAWCDIIIPTKENQQYVEPTDVEKEVKKRINKDFRLYQLAVELGKFD